LNGKPTRVVETDWRPIIQQHHLRIGPDREYQFMTYTMEQITKIMRSHQDAQFLIFVHTIAKGNQIARHYGIPFHYSKVAKEDRHNLEQAFRTKKLMALVSTSTLAYGVNLPADVGIIIGGHRGPSMVEPWDIKQMAGRIGRYGLSTTGDVYYLFKQDYAQSLYHELTAMPPVKSQVRQRLYFHVTSFIAREGMQRQDIELFLKRTLCSLQYDIDIEEAIDLLLQYEVLREDNGLLSPTRLGKASAFMYVDPIDLHHLNRSLKERPLTPGLLAEALANIPSYAFDTYVPDDLAHVINMQFGQQTIIASSLYEWLTGLDLSMTASVVVPPYIMDFERWASALGMCGLDSAYLKNLSLTVQYGIEENLLELVSIPGIGRKRALALSRHGITKKKDILENRALATNILGKKLAQSLEDEHKHPGKIFIRY
jgi:helicase